MGPLFAALLFATSPAATEADTGADADAGVRAVDERRAVVFMVGEGHTRAQAVLDAIEIQIADLDARVQTETLPASGDLGARLEAARKHAAEHQALGVFWLEVEGNGDLLLHLVDPAGERMLVRRVEASPESDTAAVQTVAVIARGFTSALLEGRSIGLYRVPAPAAPAHDDEQPPLSAEQDLVTPTRRKGRLRLGAAYYGAHVAPQADWVWQSGVAASAAWQWRIGLYAGLGYDTTQRFTTVAASEIALNPISIEVRRNPASAIFGYQHGWAGRRVALDAELRFIADVHTVHTDEAIAGSIISENALSSFLLASPRVALHFRPVRYFSANLSIGGEFALMGEDFVVEWFDDSGNSIDTKTYLTPSRFRPIVLAGMTFYL